MSSLIYDRNEIIQDFLSHDFSQTELARFYDDKYYPGYISSQTISKILNNKSLPSDTRAKINAKKESLKGKLSDAQKLIFAKIDPELYKIVLISSFVKDENMMLLRVAYLYVSGYNYTQISNMLGISKATVSSYVNEVASLNILNRVTQILLAEKMKKTTKFNNKDVNQDIARVIETFVSTNGNYSKTIELTGISERTLSRYLGTPNLEELLDADLYSKYKNVVDTYNRQRIMMASAVSARNRKIMTSLNTATTLRGKKFKSILELVLIDDITDLSELKKRLNMTYESLKEYLKADEEIKTLFGDYVYQEYENKKSVILKDDEDEFQASVILTYLNGRYSYEEMTVIGYVNKTMLRKILNEDSLRLEAIIGEPIGQIVSNHTKNVSRIRKGCPKDKIVVASPDMISIAREDLYYVSSTEYELLTCVIEYFANHGILTNCFKESDKSYYSIYTALNSERVKGLLNADAYQKLQLYLQYENFMYIVPEIDKKWKIMTSFVESFYENGLDVDKTLIALGVPVEVFERVLYDRAMQTMYIDEVIVCAKEKVAAYKQLKEKEKEKDVFTRLKEKVKA